MQVAASGGYMMASVANKVIAAPFSIVGSIGVLSMMVNVSTAADTQKQKQKHSPNVACTVDTI
jgi:ClpP class serine protease